jgi:hypothetical protein
LCGYCLALLSSSGNGFPVLGIGFGMRFVTVCLPRLSQQNEWCSISRLETEARLSRMNG